MAYKRLTRKERIQRKGYKVINTTCGKVIALKGAVNIIGNSIHDLHLKMFGY